MSWGTSYTYEGYILRVGINDLEDELNNVRNELRDSRDELLAIMAMSAPPSGMMETEDGKVPWHEYVHEKLEDTWDSLEALFLKQTMLEQAIEVKKENPKKLVEG